MAVLKEDTGTGSQNNSQGNQNNITHPVFLSTFFFKFFLFILQREREHEQGREQES